MGSPKLTVCYAVGYPRVSLRVFSDLPCEFSVHFPCIPSPVNSIKRSVVSYDASPSLSLCPFSFWSARSFRAFLRSSVALVLTVTLTLMIVCTLPFGSKSFSAQLLQHCFFVVGFFSHKPASYAAHHACILLHRRHLVSRGRDPFGQ